MGPLDILLSSLFLLFIGFCIGVKLQSDRQIITNKKIIPDINIIKYVRWKREENISDVDVMKIENNNLNIVKLYNISLVNIVKPAGEGSVKSLNNVTEIRLNCVVYDMSYSIVTKVKIKKYNPHLKEISYIMNKVGIAVEII